MIEQPLAKHTLTHAVEYLLDADLLPVYREAAAGLSDQTLLKSLDPGKPCAAYGLAKRTLRRCGSLTEAIADLTSR